MRSSRSASTQPLSLAVSLGIQDMCNGQIVERRHSGIGQPYLTVRQLVNSSSCQICKELTPRFAALVRIPHLPITHMEVSLLELKDMFDMICPLER